VAAILPKRLEKDFPTRRQNIDETKMVGLAG
jgi:hypothetical protein